MISTSITSLTPTYITDISHRAQTINITDQSLLLTTYLNSNGDIKQQVKNIIKVAQTAYDKKFLSYHRYNIQLFILDNEIAFCNVPERINQLPYCKLLNLKSGDTLVLELECLKNIQRVVGKKNTFIAQSKEDYIIFNISTNKDFESAKLNITNFMREADILNALYNDELYRSNSIYGISAFSLANDQVAFILDSRAIIYDSNTQQMKKIYTPNGNRSSNIHMRSEINFSIVTPHGDLLNIIGIIGYSTLTLWDAYEKKFGAKIELNIQANKLEFFNDGDILMSYVNPSYSLDYNNAHKYFIGRYSKQTLDWHSCNKKVEVALINYALLVEYINDNKTKTEVMSLLEERYEVLNNNLKLIFQLLKIDDIKFHVESFYLNKDCFVLIVQNEITTENYFSLSSKISKIYILNNQPLGLENMIEVENFQEILDHNSDRIVIRTSNGIKSDDMIKYSLETYQIILHENTLKLIDNKFNDVSMLC